jgi:hypothetical protein
LGQQVPQHDVNSQLSPHFKRGMKRIAARHAHAPKNPPPSSCRAARTLLAIIDCIFETYYMKEFAYAIWGVDIQYLCSHLFDACMQRLLILGEFDL